MPDYEVPLHDPSQPDATVWDKMSDWLEGVAVRIQAKYGVHLEITRIRVNFPTPDLNTLPYYDQFFCAAVSLGTAKAAIGNYQNYGYSPDQECYVVLNEVAEANNVQMPPALPPPVKKPVIPDNPVGPLFGDGTPRHFIAAGAQVNIGDRVTDPTNGQQYVCQGAQVFFGWEKWLVPA